ncbi:MAG: class I SAM-dependent methyltransferase [Candidatus Hodarchaeota archaeon]
MAKPNCRFCNAKPMLQSIKGEFVYGGSSDQHFWKCDACQIIYLFPPLSQREELSFYKKEFEKYMEKRTGVDKDWSSPEKHFISNQREVKRRMPFLETYLRKGQKILEIGCSSGFMLSALRDKGVDVYGLDPSEGFIEYVKSKGIHVYQTLEELKENHDLAFDLIIHYYVLEHIGKPVEFIRQYMKLLNGTGKMIFEIPCATDPLVELYKVPAFDKFYWSVAHHWYFNKESLAEVLKKAGYTFELFPEQRYDISNHMTWMQEGKPGGLGRYSHIFGSSLDKLYKKKLKEKWQCDTIIAVVNK